MQMAGNTTVQRQAVFKIRIIEVSADGKSTAMHHASVFRPRLRSGDEATPRLTVILTLSLANAHNWKPTYESR